MTTSEIWGCLRHLDQFEMIVEAWSIPDGQQVRKPNGSSTFQIESSIRIYDEKGERKDVKVDEDIRVLHGPRGSINLVRGSKKLVWIISAEDLQIALEPEGQ